MYIMIYINEGIYCANFNVWKKIYNVFIFICSFEWTNIYRKIKIMK